MLSNGNMGITHPFSNVNQIKDGNDETKYVYDTLNRLTQAAHATREFFSFDQLGRRIEKKNAFGVTTFLWIDNLLAQETRNNIQKTYVFEPGSFKPLTQIQDDKIYHYSRFFMQPTAPYQPVICNRYNCAALPGCNNDSGIASHPFLLHGYLDNLHRVSILFSNF